MFTSDQWGAPFASDRLLEFRSNALRLRDARAFHDEPGATGGSGEGSRQTGRICLRKPQKKNYGINGLV